MDEPVVRIELFGGLHVVRPGIEPLNFPPNQPGNLLGLLALHSSSSPTREWLTTVLWPGDDPEESRQRLRQALYLLRQELAAWSPGSEVVVTATRDAIGLDARRVETDAREFEERITAARSATDPAIQADHLNAALRLHKGDLLQGFYHECFELEQRRFEEMHRSAYQTLPLRYEAAADLPRAIDAARAAIRQDPMAEETHCCLMRLYAATGQPSAVLRQYNELEDILRSELGEEPSQATKQLMESLRDAGRAVLAKRAPASEPASDPSTFSPDRKALDNHARSLWPVLRFAILLAVMGVIALWLQRVPGLRLPVGNSTRAGVGKPTTKPPSADEIPLNLPEPRVAWTTVVPLAEGDNWSEPSGVAIGRDGSIYVCGFVNTRKTDTDYLIQQLAPDGKLGWQKRYSGPSSEMDRARGIVTDLDGNIVVTGESYNSGGNGKTNLSGLDIVTQKYDPAGRRLYTVRWNSPEDGEDRPRKLLVDRNGDILVAGSSWTGAANGGRGGNQIVCLKIPRAAKDNSPPSFATTYLGKGHLEANASDLATTDETVVVGAAATGAAKGADVETVLLRLDDQGHATSQGAPGGRTTAVHSERVLFGSGFIASAAMRRSAQGVHFATDSSFLSPSGSVEWSHDLFARRGSDDWPSAATLGPNAGFVVAGQYSQPGGNIHASFVGYDAAGQEVWRRTFQSHDAGPDRVTNLASLPGEDSIFAVGHSMKAGHVCLMVLKLSRSTGEPIWLSRAIPLPFGSVDLPDAESINIALPGDGSAVVTAQTVDDGRHAIMVVKYAP